MEHLRTCRPFFCSSNQCGLRLQHILNVSLRVKSLRTPGLDKWTESLRKCFTFGEEARIERQKLP